MHGCEVCVCLCVFACVFVCVCVCVLGVCVCICSCMKCKYSNGSCLTETSAITQCSGHNRVRF